MLENSGYHMAITVSLSPRWRLLSDWQPKTHVLECLPLFLDLKGKACDIQYFSYCQQIPWKVQNQQRIDPTKKYYLCDMFCHCNKHEHCSLFWVNPTYTVLLPYKYSPEHRMCINPWLKIVPNKCTIYSCLQCALKFTVSCWWNYFKWNYIFVNCFLKI